METQACSADEVVAVPATPPHDSATAEDVSTPLPQQRKLTSTTPPPSAQPPAAQSDDDEATVKLLLTPTTGRRNACKDLPTSQHVAKAPAEELREMIKQLIRDLTDSRISAANARLQHHFLLLEMSQAAERAEVENQLSRTQVDYLRVKQHSSPSKASAPTASAVQPPSMSDALREMESQYAALEELCDKLKREKELQAERIQSLSEHNSLLVNRIRENREHFSRMRERSPAHYTPRDAYTTPRRKGYTRYHDDTPAHGPFAALIAADQILSQETASVPSTPSKRHKGPSKSGHTRGAHSLSSIQTPQNKGRPSTSDGFFGSQLLFSAPASQLVNESAERERHDRDSTISMSDDGANGQSGELVQSQASSLATDMLRKNPSSFEAFRGSQDAEKSSNLLQSKILGNVRKSNPETSSAKLKRSYGFDSSPSKTKKMRTNDSVGLGIEA